jgi:hypothetical protein
MEKVQSWRPVLGFLLSLITLSALANTLRGIVRLICLAAFKLITNQTWSVARLADRRAWRPSESCRHKWRSAGTKGYTPATTSSLASPKSDGW